MHFYKFYEIVGPAILFPLAIFLWWSTGNANIHVTIYAVGMPVTAGFVIPYIGIRFLHIWEIRSRMSHEGFRPHHGMMFGSATSVICWLVYQSVTNLTDHSATWVLPVAIGSTIGLINFLFDIYAIKQGILIVFNRSFAQNKSAVHIALQYAPVFFTSFGIAYGYELQHLLAGIQETDLAFHYTRMLISLLISPLATEITHWIVYRESCLKSYKHLVKQ